MNRAKFLSTLAGGALALPRLVAKETAAEKAIYDLLDAAVDAQFTYDFPRLATLLHATSSRLFREDISAAFDVMLRSYSLDDIASVSGLPKHPKDLELSDVQIFVAACNSIRERHPEFVGNEKFLPLMVYGTIFENERVAHVAYSYAGAIQTERTSFEFLAPRLISVRRDRNEWLIYTCWLSRSVTWAWWQDLAKLKAERQRRG